MNTVACSNCGKFVPDDTGLTPENRTPCPDCGSTTRTIQVSARSTAFATARASAEVIVGSAPSISPLSELLIQAVVERGEKTTEGRLIEAVALPWFDIIQ